MKFSIIVPVLNEESSLEGFLSSLQPLRELGHELIVVDGGSQDTTVQIAQNYTDVVVVSKKGRAVQMNEGANKASHAFLLFLHADTFLGVEHINVLSDQLTETGKQWGRFNVRLSGARLVFRVVERLINWRSRFTHIATGDQAIFISRELFDQEGGFANIPLMEDIELCKRLRKVATPLCLSLSVETSSRRWEEKGVFATILLMWRLRLAFYLGVPPETLVKKYYG